MPDPIQSNSSSSPFQDLTCHGAEEPPPGPRCEPESSTQPRASGCEDEGLSEHVLSLVKSYPTPGSPAPHAAHVGDSNAERVSQTPLEFGYMASGRTDNGSKFDTFALLYGSDGKGYSYEFGSVSIQKGEQSEAQIAAWRSNWSSPAGDSVTVELLSAQESGGSHNKDGSSGFNTSVSASLASLEGTLRIGAGSVTAGVSAGPSLELSAGTRDIDGDGALEWCLRAGSTVTVGACVEEPSGWRR